MIWSYKLSFEGRVVFANYEKGYFLTKDALTLSSGVMFIGTEYLYKTKATSFFVETGEVIITFLTV